MTRCMRTQKDKYVDVITQECRDRELAFQKYLESYFRENYLGFGLFLGAKAHR